MKRVKIICAFVHRNIAAALLVVNKDNPVLTVSARMLRPVMTDQSAMGFTKTEPVFAILTTIVNTIVFLIGVIKIQERAQTETILPPVVI